MRRLQGLVAIVALLLVLLLGSCALAQDQVMLEYKFTPNETLDYVVTMDGSTTTAMPDLPPQKIEMKGAIDLKQTTKEVDKEGVGLLAMSCPKMSMNMNFSGNTMSMIWSSGKMTMTMNGQPQNAGAVDFSKIPFFGTPLTMKIDKSGKPVELPDLSSLEGMMGNLDVGSLMQSSQSQLPTREIGVGETWTVEEKADLMGKKDALTTKTNFKLLSLERSGGDLLAKIGMQASTSIKGLKFDSSADAGGTAMTIDLLDQRTEGTLWFNVDKGRQEKGNLQSAMTQQMTIDTPQGAQKSSVQMNMQMKMRLK